MPSGLWLAQADSAPWVALDTHLFWWLKLSLFEMIAWIAVCVETRGWGTVVFTVVAVVQMAAWAKKKERRYRKEFGRKRTFAMIPGIF